MDLFVRLHGMLFTRIDLDNFDEVLSRFMERLEEDAKVEAQTHRGPISQVDWITMASANLGAILQYGASGGVIRKALSMEGAERRRAVAHDGEVQDDDEEEREASPTPEERAPVEETLELPAMVTQALRLTVAILEHCFAHPTRQQGIHSVLNPYIALVLTFFGTVFKQQQVATLLSPYIPWQSLVVFVDQLSGEVKEESKLAVGPPLPEDWTVRGMEWVGRRVFERGFWKLKSNSRDGRGSGGLAQPRHGPSGSGEGERFASEMDVLLNNFENTLDISEGVVEEGENEVDGAVNVNHRRLRRVFWVIGLLVKHVEGLELREGKVFIESPLKEQLEEVEKKKQAEAAERERELKSRYKKEDGEVSQSERNPAEMSGTTQPCSTHFPQARPWVHHARVRHQRLAILAIPFRVLGRESQMVNHHPSPRHYRAGRAVKECRHGSLRLCRCGNQLSRTKDQVAFPAPQNPDQQGQLLERLAHSYRDGELQRPGVDIEEHGRSDFEHCHIPARPVCRESRRCWRSQGPAGHV